jgi:hypothetical protein
MMRVGGRKRGPHRPPAHPARSRSGSLCTAGADRWWRIGPSCPPARLRRRRSTLSGRSPGGWGFVWGWEFGGGGRGKGGVGFGEVLVLGRVGISGVGWGGMVGLREGGGFGFCSAEQPKPLDAGRNGRATPAHPPPLTPFCPVHPTPPHAPPQTCATGAHIATRRNSSTCGARGAPPLTISRTRPPRRALTWGQGWRREGVWLGVWGLGIGGLGTRRSGLEGWRVAG